MTVEVATGIKARLEQAGKKSSLSADVQRNMCKQNANAADLGHVHEQICAEAIALAQAGRGPTDLLHALGALGLHGLFAMAAEAHHYATVDRITEENRQALAMSSPVFMCRKRLFIAPVGTLGTAELQTVLDRSLKMVQNNKVKEVVLLLKGLDAPHQIVEDWLCLSREEFAAARITVRTIST